MKSYLRLFEFICQLIDIQIKKYSDLTKKGAGPDALMSADLARNEVNDLLMLSNRLLTTFKNSNLQDKSNFQMVFDRVKFYLNQEELRARAAWLLDANNFHSSEYERLVEQQQALCDIGKRAAINLEKTVSPSLAWEHQLQHDSNEIAYFILTIAIEAKADDNITFPSGVPKHAERIIRNHAKPGGRYHDPEIFTEMQVLYLQTKTFLDSSPLKKNQTTLTKEEAEKAVIQQTDMFKDLLNGFKKLNIRSCLFSSDQTWHSIGEQRIKPKIPENTPCPSVSKVGLFGTVVAGSVAIYLLMTYLYSMTQANTCEFRP
jgi:hypothetical protein